MILSYLKPLLLTLTHTHVHLSIKIKTILNCQCYYNLGPRLSNLAVWPTCSQKWPNQIAAFKYTCMPMKYGCHVQCRFVRRVMLIFKYYSVSFVTYTTAKTISNGRHFWGWQKQHTYVIINQGSSGKNELVRVRAVATGGEATHIHVHVR